MTDILSLDATDQIAKLAAREISSRELLEAAVRRTDQLHPRLNAVVARDLDRAFVRARKVDDRRARGEHVGALAGLPMTVKDMLDVEGLPGSAGGMPELLDRNCANAQVVGSIVAQDGNIWGKTNMSYKGGDTQSHNALYGTTNNPWDVSRTCGGSSGGSAVALATGMTALEIGGDIGGSLRCPASFCGVFAHKPTFGLVSQNGLVPPVGRKTDIDMAVVGPMARSARDLSLLLSILAGKPITAQSIPDLRELRFGLWLEEPSFSLDPLVRSSIEDFAERLAKAGVTIEKIQCPVNADQMMRVYIVLLFSQGMHDLTNAQHILYEVLRPAALTALRMGAGPISWANGIKALTARHSEWMAANEARAQIQHTMRGFFETYDGVIAPVVPVPAFPHTHVPLEIRKLTLSTGQKVSYLEMLKWIALATLCGLPATALPAGKTPAGLPVGIQLIGAHGTDMRLLGIVQAIEEQLGGFEPPPSFGFGDN